MNILTGAVNLGLKRYDILIAFLSIIFMELVHYKQRRLKMRSFLSEKPLFFRWTVYAGVLIAIMMFGVFGLAEFIYFQF